MTKPNGESRANPEKPALVIGVNGQDGSYLAEFLLEKGSVVAGIGRQPNSRYVPENPNFVYHQLDLAVDGALKPLLAKVRPERIYYLAAIHGAAGFSYEESWQTALKVNLGNVQHCLDHIRTTSPSCRFLYASSMKVFGNPTPALINPKTPRVSTCLYSITKNAATDLIDYYRTRHGLEAVVLYLLNHESPRRPRHFFLPRVVDLLASALGGERIDQPIRSLDFACDWGSSAEFMAIGYRLLEAAPNRDFVLGTGKTWTGQALVDALFQSAGLDWQAHLRVQKAPGSEPLHHFQADIGEVIDALDEGPKLSALDVAHWILSETHGIDVTGAAPVKAVNS